MLAENNEKNTKFKFENHNADFSWDISPENPHTISDENYGDLLKNVFFFDPSIHFFDHDRFRADLDDLQFKNKNQLLAA